MVRGMVSKDQHSVLCPEKIVSFPLNPDYSHLTKTDPVARSPAVSTRDITLPPPSAPFASDWTVERNRSSTEIVSRPPVVSFLYSSDTPRAPGVEGRLEVVVMGFTFVTGNYSEEC